MNLKMIKDIISLLERSGFSENTPVNITVEKNSAVNKNWSLSFNVVELQNSQPSKIEIRVKQDESIE